MIATADAMDSPQSRFAALLEQHCGIVFKVAATYCRHRDDRQDLAQEIAAQLWRAFPGYDTARPFSTWMYRIALNVAISHVRSVGARAPAVRIDHNLPVLELQQRLASLRKAYLVSGMVIGLPWWLLWVLPLMAVASLHNAHTGESGLPLWIWLCIAGGTAGILATWAFHRWLQRPGREALAKRMQDNAVGGSLRKAQAELDALKAYAEE